MSCTHDNRRQYRYALGRRTAEMCRACHDELVASTGMSLTLVERRQADMPVLVERRHAPAPRWLSNLKAKAMDTWRAA